MRRRLLIALTAVGSVIVALGAIGVFATLNDTVTSGENKIETTAAPDRVDLLIALRTQDANGNWTCGEFTDDLESGLFVMDSVDETGLYPPPVVSYCVKNNGRSHGTRSPTSVYSTSPTRRWRVPRKSPGVDVTCGSGPAGEEQPGEITKYLRVENYRGSCDADLPGPDAPGPLNGRAYTLEQLAQTPVVLTPRLGPYGGVQCFAIKLVLAIDASERIDVLPPDAQSDRLTWRFRWQGLI